MKKYALFFVIALFIILFGILFLKIKQSKVNQPEIQYSSDDIYALVKKGIENLQNTQNVCIERKNEAGITKYYYKGNKMKASTIESYNDSSVSYTITVLDEEKQYIVSDSKKFITVQKATNFYKGLQYEVFDGINTSGTTVKRELSYIKDEKIEGKDCIFVKEITYYKTDDGSFQPDSKLDVDIRAYWIEKSTGFVLGAALINPSQTSATPKLWINSITFNEVDDSEFSLPTDYEVYDSSK